MKETAACTGMSREQCRATSTSFNFMEADLHNLYPAISFVNQARSNFLFDDIPGSPLIGRWPMWFLSSRTIGAVLNSRGIKKGMISEEVGPLIPEELSQFKTPDSSPLSLPWLRISPPPWNVYPVGICTPPKVNPLFYPVPKLCPKWSHAAAFWPDLDRRLLNF